MGGCCSKDEVVHSADVDLFADPKDETETELEKFSLTDEFAFDELVEKVFKLSSDCVVHDTTGTICGRISTAYEGEGYFGKYIIIGFVSIQSNGKVFFQSNNSIQIANYPGKEKLSNLPVRPILLGEKEKLAERGRKFSKLGLGAHYRTYSDNLFVRGCCGAAQISAVGRVMVDTASFLHFNPNYQSLGGARQYGYNADDACNADEKECSKTIPEHSLHLCWPTLCGFSLAKKKWGEICLDHLSEIQFREDAFDLLVLEKGSKDLVRSLVENIHKDEQFTDIIQGKGGGCSMLLQGPPGVGKTLTAEAVSEVLHRPLYCIDVGELGITPEVLEEKLKQILEVAERWNAVVLIDECDIFLAARNKSDILRNAMVGIFLRLLEYYNGILFLTSNRADEMDQAFQSRISVTLEYKDLDVESRKLIWTNLLSAAGTDTKHLDVSQLAVHGLNGRQIKTAIRLATSLAGTAKEPLSQHHLLDTIRYANVQPTATNT